MPTSEQVLCEYLSSLYRTLPFLTKRNSYTLNGIWPPDKPAPSEEDVIGGVSAIIWAIIILPLFKYVCIVPLVDHLLSLISFSYL